MRERSSSKQERITRSGVLSEKHKINTVKNEPRLSGAYIRSLVKHLTSIKSKDSFTSEEYSFVNRHNMQQESPPPPLPPEMSPEKKKVRRRHHTSKPYQERLLNMAEARKEIVTALKFHRASMKQEISQKFENYSTLNCPVLVPRNYPISTISPSPPPPSFHHENLDFTLPNQTLGLNLNFHDFKHLDANLYLNPLSVYATSSSVSSTSSSSSSSSAVASSEAAASVPEEAVATSSGGGICGNDMHHAVDDDEMEEIRSLSEKHEMEWNDTVNLMMSAQWFEFLKTFEIETEDGKDDNVFNRFD